MVNPSNETKKLEMDPNALLLDCIDKGLKSFGDSIGRVIYWRLEQSKNLPRSEIPRRLNDFVVGLQEMFGNGVECVNRSITKEVRNHCSSAAINKDDDLLSTLTKARADFQASVWG